MYLGGPRDTSQARGAEKTQDLTGDDGQESDEGANDTTDGKEGGHQQPEPYRKQQSTHGQVSGGLREEFRWPYRSALWHSLTSSTFRWPDLNPKEWCCR